MDERAENDEDVPHGMETELIREEIEPFGDIHGRAESIDDASDSESCQGAGRKHSQHFPDGKERKPAHDHIDSGRQPARRAHHEHFHDHADHGQRPDDRQNSPSPKTREHDRADGRVGPGYQ